MTDGAPVLVLGPLLRYVGEHAVTVWVETDRACQVEILDRQARTFEVAGHYYALVVIDGLPPGAEYTYQVTLDGTVRWPEPGSEFPPSVLRTLAPGRPLRLAFGSCRVAELPVPRRRSERARDEAEHGADALIAWAGDLRETSPGRWPDAMLMIGDQVYADDVGPATRKLIEQRRDPSDPPGHQVADFAEYCFLYREAWSEPSVRWLLSVMPSAMIFDDHDVHDDWNTSAAWRRDYQAKPWWPSRIRGAYMSYWIYQHLGNLSPEELGKSDLWRQVQEQPDAAALLGDLAVRADGGDIQWSFARAFGNVQVVVIDSRSGRVLEDGKRLMVGEAEWQWVTEAVSGEREHLVLASSLPLMLPRGIHGLEAWNEAVCGGAWGKRFARVGEWLRRDADLEHWAAFGTSFAAFERLLTGLVTGAHGEPPASITVLGGDIHHSYLATVDFPPGTGPAGTRPPGTESPGTESPGAEAPGSESRCAVFQAVCSPLHNKLPPKFRRAQKLTTSRAGELAGRVLARLAGVKPPRLGWRITQGPWFWNMLAALEFDGRTARIRFDRPARDETGASHLETVGEAELTLGRREQVPAGHHLGGELAVPVVVEQDREPVGLGLEHQARAPLMMRDPLAGGEEPGRHDRA
jgi:phosphodiesterase/alkaline phosphatase D-like protein